MSEQALLDPSSTAPTSRQKKSSASSAPLKSPDVTRQAHFVLQGKGGVGKTLVASLLAQWLAGQGRLAGCYDTDPVNKSFSSIPAHEAQTVELLTRDTLNVKAVDRLVSAMIEAQGDLVIDNGAASFLPLSRYLTENDIPAFAAEHGAGVTIHTVVTGGANGLDTLKGMDLLCRYFAPAARIVVWVNEFFGPAVYRDVPFENTALYEAQKANIAGVIRLEALDPVMFGPNFAEMLDRKMTFAEAMESEGFMLMEKSRLARIRHGIWQQIAGVI